LAKPLNGKSLGSQRKASLKQEIDMEADASHNHKAIIEYSNTPAFGESSFLLIL
jgi:hypothetical protein